VGNVGNNSVSSYRLHASETQQLSYVQMADAAPYPSVSCVELLWGSHQPGTGRLATHRINTTVKIWTMAVQFSSVQLSSWRDCGTVTCLVEIVVEVGVACTQVAAEDRGMSREDRRDVDVSCATDDQADGRQPLVEVRHNVRRLTQSLPELHSQP